VYALTGVQPNVRVEEAKFRKPVVR
jgi:hypothetical protein